MTTMHQEPDPAFVLRVLRTFDRVDDRESLFWRTPATGINYTFFVNCSDLFWWGTSDLEEITPDNIAQLEQAIDDVSADAWRFGHLGVELFVARMRKMRPQGAWYQQVRKYQAPDSKETIELVLALFDECGPEREQGLGNPRKQTGTTL